MSLISVELGSVCKFENGDRGKNYPSKGSFQEAGVPFINAGNLSGGKIQRDSLNYISEDTFERIGGGKIKKGDVLFCLRGSLGKYAVVSNIEKGAIASSLIIIRPEFNLDLSYLKHYLGSTFCKNEIERFENGAAQPNLSGRDLKKFILPLPPLEEQKRIAAILDKAYAIRRKRQTAIELADQFLRSVFLELFGDPVTNPKGLNVSSLIDICEKVTDGTHQSPEWTSSGVPFLFISNIVNYKISFEVKKYISNDSFEKLTKRSPIEQGDILYTTVGSYGNAAEVGKNIRFCFQRHIAHIKPNKALVDPTFLWVMMNSPVIKAQADKKVKGVAQKTLNLVDLKNFQVFVPPMDKQKEFVQLIESVIVKSTKLSVQSVQISLLFNSLTQKAFKGELVNK